MTSIRRKLVENVNDSKNTRMEVAGPHSSWKTDELGHITRYCKIAELILDEWKHLGRRVDLLEAGCGQVWVLRHIYKSIFVEKAKVVSSYLGVDIDPAVLNELPGWAACETINESTWLNNYNGRIAIQDLTVNPVFALANESVDVFWTTEVIEHMKPEFVEPWIKDAHRCLRPGGLAYVSTPNHDGSNKTLPLDHVYEWGHAELIALLEKYFTITDVKGVFIQMPKFKKAQTEWHRWPDDVVCDIQRRFSNEWARVILATPYPEYANNAAFVLRKRIN